MPNNTTSKYSKHTWIKLQPEIHESTIYSWRLKHPSMRNGQIQQADNQ